MQGCTTGSGTVRLEPISSPLQRTDSELIEVKEDPGTAGEPEQEEISADEVNPEPSVKKISENGEPENKEPDKEIPEKVPEKKAPEKTKVPKKPAMGRQSFSASFFKCRKPQIVLLITIFLLLIVVLLLVATEGTNKYGIKKNYMDQIRNQEIKLNDVDAIDHFFSAYYTAMASGNTTELERMFDDPSKAHITTEVSTIVNQYDNFKVYVTPGIREGDIVAFVSNDIHFANIDATAPSVDSFYLTYDPEEAALKIRTDMYTDQNILRFMNLVSYREPIRSLLFETNNRLSEALASNTDLNNLYVLMQSMMDASDYSETGSEDLTETATTEE